MLTKENLIKKCQELIPATYELEDWVKNNSSIVKSQSKSILESIRKNRRKIVQCNCSLNRKMCVGVFGPSQSGKSYLLSAIARNSSGNLFANFYDEQIDFITKINPSGGKESTGLVTRFTLDSSKGVSSEFPVHLTLLSEIDLVKIFCNTYYSDCTFKEEVNEELIVNSLNEIDKCVHQGDNGISLDDIEELKEYIDQFGFVNRVQSFKRVFWSQATELLMRASLENRIKVYSILWNETKELTDKFKELVYVLEKIDYASDVFCEISSLLPREESIIDVECLKADSSNSPEIYISTHNNKKLSVKKSVISALTAELTITMSESPDPIFSDIDLLDFPGYRARYKITDLETKLKEEPRMINEMFLRGKVAYLFQRYCDQKELSNMLLCIGPGNQEVQDLPIVINKWIGDTIGNVYTDRQVLQYESLFFILTKCDVNFERKQGVEESDLDKNWDIRLHASLIDFFGKQGDWVGNWVSKNIPFNNLFLLRNPNVRFDSILDYVKEKESSIRPEKIEYVEKLKEAFLKSKLVNSHFKRPRNAWDALMSLNDGGISYIRENLAPSCKPEIKLKQIENTILDCCQTLYAYMNNFYHNVENSDQELEKKKNFLVQMLKMLNRKNNETFKLHFSELIGELSLSRKEIYDCYREAQSKYSKYRYSSDVDNNLSNNQSADFSFDNDDLENLIAEFEAHSSSSHILDDKKNEWNFYSEVIFQHWFIKLDEISSSHLHQKYFAFDSKSFNSFVYEIKTAAVRLKLQQHLDEEFAKISNLQIKYEKKRNIMASYAFGYLSHFLSWLGLSSEDANQDQRTIKIIGSDTSIEIFKPKDTIEDGALPQLKPFGDQDKTSFEWEYHWLLAFYSLMVENIKKGGGFDLEANSLLGKILTKIELYNDASLNK